MQKPLLSAGDLTASDITRILDTAAHLAKVTDRAIKKVPTLRGRTVCNLFFEDSTRTRISFELAAKRLSADAINFSAKDRKSTRLNSSHANISYAVFCLKKKKK